jgi:O-antigen ligase
MRRTLAAEPALWMPTISASTRVRSACPVAMLFVARLDLSLLCSARFFAFVEVRHSHFWEAWAFWLLLSVLSAVVTFYFLKHDPGLVESRLKAGPSAEHERSQKIIKTPTAILWCALKSRNA